MSALAEGHADKNAIKALWRQRAVIVVAGLVAMALAGLYAFLTPAVYRAETTFLPRAEESGSNMMFGQIISMAGLSLDQGGIYESLYGRILVSDRLLDTLFDREWTGSAGGEPRALATLLGIDCGDPMKDAALSKRLLRNKLLSFSRDRSTGFMKLAVSIPRHPVLAADIANYLADELDGYLGEASRTRAGDQRRFIEQRAAEVLSELVSADRALADFEEENRAWATSPRLALRHSELERESGVKSALWIELRRQLELARIDEHKDVMRLEILDRAVIPLERSAPRRGLAILLGALLGCTLGAVGVLIRDQRAGA